MQSCYSILRPGERGIPFPSWTWITLVGKVGTDEHKPGGHSSIGSKSEVQERLSCNWSPPGYLQTEHIGTLPQTAPIRAHKYHVQTPLLLLGKSAQANKRQRGENTACSWMVGVQDRLSQLHREPEH